MKSKVTYVALGIVFVLSVAASIALPIGDIARTMAATPAILSLFGALFAIGRDRIAHERALLIHEAENTFSIGATSHMAEVAFDKYALFCEEYVAEMFKALTTLTREGPRQSALDHAASLSDIRRKYAVWLTPNVEKNLSHFEHAIRKIGANAMVLAQVPGEPGLIKEMYAQFAEVVGLEHWDNQPITGENAVTTVIQKLRNTLGIDELNLLRGNLVRRALQNLPMTQS